jgi:hypothetical protein
LFWSVRGMGGREKVHWVDKKDGREGIREA